MVAYGEFPDLVFEFPLGLVAHASGTRRQEKAEKLVAFSKGRDARLLRAQLETQFRLQRVDFLRKYMPTNTLDTSASVERASPTRKLHGE